MSIPRNLGGYQVLLVETDKKSMQHHAYVLIQSSYRVTSTMKISEALSMITHGNTFDCVLVDAQNRDMDLVDFLHTIWTHRPHLRVIVMTSSESHMQLARENLANDVIWFLRKPCGVSSICSMLQRVCGNRLAYGDGTSTGKSLEENPICKSVQNVNTKHPSTIFNITMINNTSSSNGTHQGLNINKYKYGGMSKPLAYVDITSDDDESIANKNIWNNTARNKDKGKQPMELKRKNKPPAECSERRKRTYINKHNAWTPPLREKFPATSLSKEGAYPMSILNHMNVPGLTRAQVASPLQRIQEREPFSMKPMVVGQMQTGVNSQVESYAFRKPGLLIPSNNNLSSSSLRNAFNHNWTGISFMNFNNIIARQPQSPQLLPQQSATTINNSVGHQVTEYGNQLQPLIGETSMCGNFVGAGGSAASEGLAQFDRFGIPIEPCITVGGRMDASLNVGLDEFTFPEVISHDLEGVSHPQEFQGNGEILFDFEKEIDNFANAISIGSSLPRISGVENNNEAQIQALGNSIVPLDGSDGRLVDNEWLIKLFHDHEVEDSIFNNNMGNYGF